MESDQYGSANSSIRESNVPAGSSETDISVWNPQALYEWVIPSRDVFLIHYELWRRMIVFKMWDNTLQIYFCLCVCVGGRGGGVIGSFSYSDQLWIICRHLTSWKAKLFHTGTHEEPIEFQCLHSHKNTTFQHRRIIRGFLFCGNTKTLCLGWE